MRDSLILIKKSCASIIFTFRHLLCPGLLLVKISVITLNEHINSLQDKLDKKLEHREMILAYIFNFISSLHESYLKFLEKDRYNIFLFFIEHMIPRRDRWILSYEFCYLSLLICSTF